MGKIYQLFIKCLGPRVFAGLSSTQENSTVRCFYGGLNDHIRKDILLKMTQKDGIIRCLICTIAFGMGVDVKGLSTVIHWGCSKSVSNYWQEVGRVGRNTNENCLAKMFCVRNKMQSVDEEMKTIVKKNWKVGFEN